MSTATASPSWRACSRSRRRTSTPLRGRPATRPRELANAIFRHVPEEEPAAARAETPATHRVYRPGRGDAYSVHRTGPGAFRVEGERVERLIARHDADNDEALRYVEERLRALGVIKALESAGFEPGDDVEIGGIVFELDPG